MLRQIFPDRWLRIHSLPESKRYPEKNEGIKELLTRQNTLIDELIGENNQYLLLLGSFESISGFPKGYDKILNISEFNELDSLPLHKLFSEEYSDGEMYLRLAVKTLTWRKNSIDQLLLAIAKDEVTNVMIIGDEQKCLICPYDGGVDIFLEKEILRDIYKMKYKCWAPKGVNGL